MSFATETKEELIREGSFRHSCCRAAFSAGLLFSAEAEGKRVTLRLTGKNLAEYCAEVLRKQYGQAPEVTVRSRFRRGTLHPDVFLFVGGTYCHGICRFNGSACTTAPLRL